jgi:DNA mismatch repair ATPase MutS
MIALIVLMAQIGSHVPAQSVRMGLHDSILTRMGGKLFGGFPIFTRSHW